MQAQIEPSNLQNLGKALTVLGLEDRFLENGELQNYALVERGRLANEIITQKLSLGRWQSVIDMIFGKSKKASTLYEGNINQLRDSIVKSVKDSNKRDRVLDNETIKTLKESKDYDLLFRLALETPSDYETYIGVTTNLPDDYFEDNPELLRTYLITAGNKALESKKFHHALNHFRNVSDRKGIEKVFESAISPQDFSIALAEDILDKELLDEKPKRLSEIVNAYFLPRERDIWPKSVFDEAISFYNLVKRNNIVLTEEQTDNLKDVLMQLDYSNLKKLSSPEPELLISWAEEHSKSQPKYAYEILSKEPGYSGDALKTAIKQALKNKRENNNSFQGLGYNEIPKEYLEQVYSDSDYATRVSIAIQLSDDKKLQDLSREAAKNGKYEEAHRYWMYGRGDLKGQYIQGLRDTIIKEDLKKSTNGYVFININPGDKIGRTQAFDTLMQNKTYERLSRAYDIAEELKDDNRLQQAREAMVILDSNWALDYFTRQSDNIDKAGISNVIDYVSREFSASSQVLQEIVTKYTAPKKE